MKRVNDSRRVEKLIALMRYEMSPIAGGCCEAETTNDLLKLVSDVMLDPPGDAPNGELTAKQIKRIDEGLYLLADHLLLALVEAGHLEAAEAFVERVARSRRDCDAKFRTQRRIPWASEKEQNEHAKSWDAARAACDAANASTEVQ